jgi:hypothetical protein
MTVFLIIVASLSVAVLVMILIAPWKEVRNEPKLDKTVETKLLLHRDPDEPTGEYPRVGVVPGLDDETDPDATYDDLSKLDDEVDEADKA